MFETSDDYMTKWTLAVGVEVNDCIAGRLSKAPLDIEPQCDVHRCRV